MLVRLESQDFRRSRRDCCKRWAPFDDRMARRPGRAAEMEAQVAMGRVVRGQRLVVLEPVDHVRGAREQQRQQRDERYQAVVAGTANAGEWGRSRTHERSETIGWPAAGQLKDNHL